MVSIVPTQMGILPTAGEIRQYRLERKRDAVFEVVEIWIPQRRNVLGTLQEQLQNDHRVLDCLESDDDVETDPGVRPRRSDNRQDQESDGNASQSRCNNDEDLDEGDPSSRVEDLRVGEGVLMSTDTPVHRRDFQCHGDEVADLLRVRVERIEAGAGSLTSALAMTQS